MSKHLTRCRIFGLLGLFLFQVRSTSQAQGSFDIKLPRDQQWPSVACTPEELVRIRAAHSKGGRAGKIVAERIHRAENVLRRPLSLPPEGGQHNQWYQCFSCQTGLITIDSKHHRCPVCGETYSGYPYDNVLYKHAHVRLSFDLEACAWAYALTGDTRFAQRTRDILIAYAERYSTYPYHSANMAKRTDSPDSSGGHVFEQTLSEASWVTRVCVAYDLVRRSPVFTATDHSTIRSRLLLKVFQNIAKNPKGRSNWQTWHNAAIVSIGGVLHDETLVRRALEDRENGFFRQFENSILPNGMWYEKSWAYHFYSLKAIEVIAETARRLGFDLVSMPKLQKMYSLPFEYRMVDGTLPRFGDSTTITIPGGVYEAAYYWWKNPIFISVLSSAPNWKSIMYGRKTDVTKTRWTKWYQSIVEMPFFRHLRTASTTDAQCRSIHLKDSGHAILRINGRDGCSSAVLSHGSFGGEHGHLDQLSFVYYALNQELGVDPGRAVSQAYRLPVHRDWYRSTISHNAVLVDRKPQRPASGLAELFAESDSMAVASAYTVEAYPGIRQHRLLVLRPGFLIVSDVMVGMDGNSHTYDWVYHNRGHRIICNAVSTASEHYPLQGFEYVTDARQGDTDHMIRATFELGELRIALTMNSSRGTKVLTGMGIGESSNDRVPMLCDSNG